MKYEFYYTGIRDLDRSLKFYGGLGMKIVLKSTMPHGGKIIHLRSPESKQTLELNWYPTKSRFYTVYTSGEELEGVFGSHLVPSTRDVSL